MIRSSNAVRALFESIREEMDSLATNPLLAAYMFGTMWRDVLFAYLFSLESIRLFVPSSIGT